MKESAHRVSIALIGAALLLALVNAEAQIRQESSPRTLTLGLVFQGAREPVEKHFRPLVDYAASKISPTGQTKGAVIIAPSPGQMMKLLEEKRVDFYMESAYPTYLINRLGAAKLLLRRWKGGIADYRSVIFTSKERGIARLEDLRGKMIAFEDPGSTSGYFLPKLLLLKKGLYVVEKTSLGA